MSCLIYVSSNIFPIIISGQLISRHGQWIYPVFHVWLPIPSHSRNKFFFIFSTISCEKQSGASISQHWQKIVSYYLIVENVLICKGRYFATLHFRDFGEFLSFFYRVTRFFVKSRKTRIIGVAKIFYNKVFIFLLRVSSCHLL